MILDEADRMLDMGFEKDMRSILQHQKMPGPEQRQTQMFSATFPEEIQQLAADFMNNYIFLAIGRVGSTSSNITQKFLLVPEDDKRTKLVELLKSAETGLTLVFCNSKVTCDALDYFLR